MNAKNNYRLQRRLQAALVRVTESVLQLKQAGLTVNLKNMLLASGVAGLLGELLTAPMEGREMRVSNEVVQQTLAARKQRARETRKRRRRQLRAGEREAHR